MHRDGNYLFHNRYESLETKVLKFFGKVLKSQNGLRESGVDLLEIKFNLEQNIPVIVSLEFPKNWAHSVLVIGMELDKSGIPSCFYVLDPANPLPFGMYWNGIIQMGQKETNYPDFYYPQVGPWEKCCVKDWLVFEKN
jgi:hypothetical protein